MNSQEIISVYEQVADLSGRMLHAARAGDWDSLVALESDCALQISTLRQHEDPVMLGTQAAAAVTASLPEPMRQQKAALIQKILADDKEIRDLTQPWMQRLSALINSTGTERKLSRAYGASHER